MLCCWRANHERLQGSHKSTLFVLSLDLFHFSKSVRKGLLSCDQKSRNWLGKDSVRKVVLGGVWEDLGDRRHLRSCWWLKTDLWPSGAGNPPGEVSVCVGCAVAYWGFPSQCFVLTAEVSTTLTPGGWRRWKAPASSSVMPWLCSIRELVRGRAARWRQTNKTCLNS